MHDGVDAPFGTPQARRPEEQGARRRDPRPPDDRDDERYDPEWDGGWSAGDDWSEDDDRGDDGRSATDLIPARLRAAFDVRREGWRPVDSLAGLIIALQILLLWLEASRGSLYLDDLRAQAYALHQPFWQFIVGSNGTHFAPLPRIADWVQSRWFPLEHGPAVVLTLLIRLGLAVAFWRLLRRLFGPRPITLVPFALFAVTPALLAGTLWFRQSLTVVACTMFMLWALEAPVRRVQTGRRLPVLEVGLATALGVGCYEKAVLLPVLLTVLTAVLFARGGPGGGRAGRTVTRPWVRLGRPGVLLSGLVVAGFLVIYRSGPYDTGDKGALDPVMVLRLLGDVVVRDVVPLLFGGPYTWSPTDPYYLQVELGTVSTAVTAVLLGLGVLFALWRRTGATLRALLFGVVWLVPSVVLVAAGRLDALGLSLAHSPRLWTDLVPAFILVGSLALLRWEAGAVPPAPTAAPAEDRAGRGRRSTTVEITTPRVAGALVALAVVVGSAISTVTFVDAWWKNPTGLYLANLRGSVSAAEPYARVLATPLPPAVMPAFVTTQLPTAGPLMELVRSDLRFHDGDGNSRALSPGGVLSPVTPWLLGQSRPPNPYGELVRLQPGKAVRVSLLKPVPYQAGAQLDVAVFLDKATRVEVQVITPEGRFVPVQRLSDDPTPSGGHTVHFPVPYNTTVAGVHVTVDAAGPTTWVSAVRVWLPVTTP